MKTVSAAEANRQFSRLMRDVRAGETVIVTSRGLPVMEMRSPTTPSGEERRRDLAWIELTEHLKTRPVLGIPIAWTRDDVYDDDF